MQTIHNIYYTFDKRIYFFFLIAFALLFTYLVQELFITDELYYATLGEQLSYERINQLIANQAKWSWLSYAMTPLYYLLKFSLVALTLLTASIFMDIKISFKRLFQVALLAEIIFLMPVVLKVVWFGFIETPESFEQLAHFYPLSLASLFEVSNLNPWEIYPLQLFNVFELVYWFLLAFGVSVFSQADFHKSFRTVLYGYGSGLVLWVVLVVFLSVTFTT